MSHPPKLDITPEVDRMTVGQGAAVRRRPDAPVEVRRLGEIPVTPRLLLLCAYLDSFHAKGWAHQRVYDVCRALGFKPQDLADGRAVIDYRRNR